MRAGRAALAFAVAGALLGALPAAAKRRPGRPEDDRRRGGSDRAFARARVIFRSPADRATVAAGDVPLELAVTGYALGGTGTGPAPHVHLLVDSLPALQLDDVRGPWVLRGLPPGPHLLRAVLCRPWHEVVKAPHAFALVRIVVGPVGAAVPRGGSGDARPGLWPEPRKPLLTYVLPIGRPPLGAPKLELVAPGTREESTGAADAGPPAVDRGDAGAVDRGDAGAADGGGRPDPDAGSAAADAPILDFFLSGAKLGRRGAKVRVVLDRRELPLVTDWKPLRLRRARGGPHQLTVDLLDRRGLKVGSGPNRTDRTFFTPAD